MMLLFLVAATFAGVAVGCCGAAWHLKTESDEGELEIGAVATALLVAGFLFFGFSLVAATLGTVVRLVLS
jgi:hypothetical protein